MKFIYFILFLLLIIACASNKELSVQDVETEAENDSVSYELIVLDPGFENWFITNRKPSWFYSQNYYENWNERYVSAWNYGHLGFRHRRLISCYIDYDPRIDYGVDLNHKLFYYFQYVENVLKIPIIHGGPRAARY